MKPNFYEKRLKNLILLLAQNEEEIIDMLREYLKKRRFKGYNVKIFKTGIDN